MHNLLQELVSEAVELNKFLTEAGQISLLRFASNNLRKTIVLSAASLFEHRVTEALLSYTDRASSSNECILSLVKIKAIKRQYHTYFEWDKLKLGSFPTLLGELLGARLKSNCAQEPGKGKMSSFLELGQLRNYLVHQNFGEYIVDKSFEEICVLCEKADAFVEMVEELLEVGPRQSASPPMENSTAENCAAKSTEHGENDGSPLE